jgi:protein-S-isoprenylcysteine O-methyltransferase Ste14
VIVSRKSLLSPTTHGFTRFLAWEVLLGQFLLNADSWFRDPLAWHQIISWFLLVISIILVFFGVKLLREIGEPDEERDDPSLLGMEKTSRLVTSGLYGYIRHPLYSSLLFLGWGMFFKSPSWLDAGLVLLTTLFLALTARAEEGENIEYFGEPYALYMRRTKMFVPFIF